jgi:hypothetical protein
MVDAAADLRDRSKVGVHDRAHGTRALSKELDRGRLGERSQRVLTLAGDAERLAARDDDAQVRARREQVAHRRRRVDHLLEVVEHE